MNKCHCDSRNPLRWSQEPTFKVWSKSGHNSWDIADIEFMVGGGWWVVGGGGVCWLVGLLAGWLAGSFFIRVSH